MEQFERQLAVAFPPNTAPAILCNVFGAYLVSDAIILNLGFVDPNAVRVIQKGMEENPDMVEAMLISKLTLTEADLDKFIETLVKLKQGLRK